MSVLRQIFETLREYYAGELYRCWPDDPIGVIVGAILVQGSTWKSVDKVLDIMYPQGFMDFEVLVDLPNKQLMDTIRPVRFQSKKAQRLKAIAKLFLEYFRDSTDCGDDTGRNSIERFFVRDIETVRRELLSVSGIGAATADSIMLYAGNLPVYVVDLFTIRLMRRHGIVSATADVKSIQEWILRELTPDEEPYGADLFKRMQGYVVRLGRDICGKTAPKCSQCPLRSFLPNGDILPVTPQKMALPPTVRQQAAVPQPQKTAVPAPADTLPEGTEAEKQIFLCIGTEPTPIDTVAAMSHLPIHIVRATVAILQMKKFVRQVEGNNVVRIV
ncbi:MAG: hypothetical protein LBT46_12265 [Planctomycetaceae bacterium]|jgi:endonuclease-3 related protein|nr:hypothetical protein [Planctomycetaceae bacterium]